MNYTDLLSTVSDVHSAAIRGTAKAVNHLHVLRNWTIGCLIVEFEQHGEDRAAYGERMLRNLCDDLAAKGMTGLGLSTLKGCRTFYRTYPQMGQSAIGQFGKDQVMQPGDEPPVGLILCTDKNQIRVSYATAGLDQELFVSRYLVALPKPEELQALIERDTAAWLQNQPSEA